MGIVEHRNGVDREGHQEKEDETRVHGATVHLLKTPIGNTYSTRRERNTSTQKRPKRRIANCEGTQYQTPVFNVFIKPHLVGSDADGDGKRRWNDARFWRRLAAAGFHEAFSEARNDDSQERCLARDIASKASTLVVTT